MKIRTTTILSLITAFALFSCQNDLAKKKAELDKLMSKQEEISTEIEELKQEIAEMDPSFGQNSENATLVSTTPVNQMSFEHKIEVRGTIESRQNVLLSTEVSGMIRDIRVREGQQVKKGDLLIVLDAETIRRNIEELKTSLELATIVFERQSRLWEQNVGSEIQYLEAKNKKESLEKSLATMQSQLAKTRIRAPFTGSIDEVAVKEGEFAMTGMPMIRIVSLDQLYINADVSEKYIGKFNRGDSVNVTFPAMDKRVKSTISAVSDVINSENRTFTIEVSLGSVDFKVKPNMIVITELTDYRNQSAFVIPTNIIQKDDIGNYVFTLQSDEEGTTRAKKHHIDIGISYNGMTEVLSGLTTDDYLVEKGFRELNDGTLIEIVSNQTDS